MQDNFQEEYQEEKNTPLHPPKNTPLDPSPSNLALQFGGQAGRQEGNKEGMGAQPDSLGKGQKIAVGFLGVFAVFVMIFWATQFKRGITDPLAYKGEKTEETSSLYQEDTESDLKNKDTDKDGLNDWEELNIYLTSPYLDDSDSDGYKDKEEIDNDNDPNCPVGRDCYGVGVNDIEQNLAPEEENVTSDEELLNLLLDEINNQENIETTSDELNQSEAQALEYLLSGKANASEIREVLKVQGMNEDVLSKLNDEQIMDIYQETLVNSVK